MAKNYQALQSYRGSLYGEPSYQGIEYDFEVPDNTVVSSPGGVSAIQHHYTKGMYSTASSRSDVYGGEGYRYPYGEFGNLYQTGQNAATQVNDFYQPPDRTFTQNEGTPRIDNYVGPTELTGVDDSFGFVPPPDSREGFVPAAEGPRQLKSIPPWVLALVLLFSYIAISFWTEGGRKVIESYHGRKLTWKWLLFYGAVSTLVVIIILSLVDVPFVSVEKL
jgi:hypothetical protein